MADITTIEQEIAQIEGQLAAAVADPTLLTTETIAVLQSELATLLGQLAPCFVSGTAIRTTDGDVAVEDLRVGQQVVTSGGATRPIRWLGHRTVAVRNAHESWAHLAPVRIARDAFGENRPQRDLLVSPGHSLCLDVLGEVLIPASALINGISVAQEDVDSVTYWHVELDAHDVLFAENMPAESYLDMGNRAFFVENGVVALGLLPDAPTPTHADFCRPFHADGPLVELVQAQACRRAEIAAQAREVGDGATEPRGVAEMRNRVAA